MGRCKDEVAHCYNLEDGSVFCDLCNKSLSISFEQHKQCPTHIRKRKAYLLLDKVPLLLKEDRFSEVVKIWNENR